MTLRDAIHQRIPRVRQPIWAEPNCYLKLTLLSDGTWGPWAFLFSRETQEAIGEPTPQSVLLLAPGMLDSDSEFVEYLGPRDPKDTAV